MKNIKRSIMTCLALVCAFSFTIPKSTEVQAAVRVPKQTVEYFRPITSNEFYIKIPGMKKSQKITSLKSSNNKVAAIVGGGYYESEKMGSIGYAGLKPGSATISFKIGGKKYKTKVTIKNYTNPVKTLSLTGVTANGKKNFASLTDKRSFGGYGSDPKLNTTKTIVNPKLHIVAKKGWKIKTVIWGPHDKIGTKLFKNSVSKADLRLNKESGNKIVPHKQFSIDIIFVNTKTKGTLQISHTVNFT